MQFELSTEFLNSLREGIRNNNQEQVKKLIEDLHPADIAEIMAELVSKEAWFIYSLLNEKEASEVVIELDRDLRKKLFSTLSSEEIAKHVENLDTDDATDVISELTDAKQTEVLSHVDDHEQASDIVDLLKYPEDTAGSIMGKELIMANANWTVMRCVAEMRRQAQDVKSIYTIYVVDDNEKLLGILSLKKLLLVSEKEKIENIYNDEVISVTIKEKVEDVANIMDKYNLVAIPVVDEIGRLVGRITIDDAVDILRKEETEDVQKMAGMEALDEPYMTIPFFQLIKKRAGWLVILFVGESLTATAMSFFEGQIAKAVVLALFIPLIISSGGNTGSQASSLIIRALALGEVNIREWWNIVKKEFFIGLSLGLILGLVGFLRVALWSQFTTIYGPHWLSIGLTVGLSLIGVVLWGNLAGSVLPILLKRAGLDPAVSSAPFVATLIDVTGLIIYFTIASIILAGTLL